jgi:hypothetical protein
VVEATGADTTVVAAQGAVREGPRVSVGEPFVALPPELDEASAAGRGDAHLAFAVLAHHHGAECDAGV